MSNTWPGGKRHAMHQSAHEEWNARIYPGTRQLCSKCDCATGRCEDDSLFVGEDGPLCEICWQALNDETDDDDYNDPRHGQAKSINKERA